MDRSAAARIAAYESWAATAERSARTAPGRAGLLARFEREARERFPGATDRQVTEAADAARRAHFARMAAASAEARRARRA